MQGSDFSLVELLDKRSDIVLDDEVDLPRSKIGVFDNFGEDRDKCFELVVALGDSLFPYLGKAGLVSHKILKLSNSLRIRH